MPIKQYLGDYMVENYGDDFIEKIWSDKNDNEPNYFSFKSPKKAWFKCPLGIHEDEQRTIYNATNRGFCCRKCSIIEQHNQQRNNLVGNKYGKWTVVSYDLEKSKEKGFTYWICNCDCGNKNISVVGESLVKGISQSCGCIRSDNSGENHYNWKGGVTPEYLQERRGEKYNTWRNSVFQRDDYTCQCCLKRGCRLNAHHIFNFYKYKDIRFNVDNGISLCDECHSIASKNSFHSLYGVKDNNIYQLIEYINNKRKELGIKIPFDINIENKLCLIKQGG